MRILRSLGGERQETIRASGGHCGVLAVDL
jgi:hypothetical protein